MRLYEFARGRWVAGAGLGGVKLRLVGMILLVALPLVAVLGFALVEARARNVAAAHERALAIAHRAGEQFEASINGMRGLLQTLAFVPEVVAGSPQTCAAFLARAGTQLSWAAQFWVMGTDGRIICSTVPGAVGTDRSDREYFKQAMVTREFGISDFVRGRSNGAAASVLTLPVFDENGEITRILATSLRLTWFSGVFAEVAGQSGATMMLFDGHGILLARYPERAEWIGRDWRGWPVVDRMEGHLDGWAELTDRSGVERIVGWAAVPGTPAHIAVSFERAQVLADVNRKTIRDALVAFIAMASAGLAGFALARGIVRPLKLLTAGAEAARSSAEGVLPKISGYAEVTSLASSLDALLTDRRQRELALMEARTAAERAEHEAREAHKYLTSVIEILPEGIIIFDADDRLVLWNRCFAEHYPFGGLNRGERFEDRLRAAVASGAHPSARGREEAWIAERLARHNLPESDREQEIAGDRWIRVRERRLPDGTRIGVRSDITELKRREESFRLLFENSPVPMWVHDHDTGRILAVNDAAVGLYGYERDAFLTMMVFDLQLAEYAGEAVSPQSGVLRERNWRHARADGTAVEVTTYSRALEYEGRSARLVAIVDVTDRKRAEARITHMAHHDDLTGLANRVLFRQCLDAAAARARERGRVVGVLYVDLDNFKDINDALGHPVGDMLLRAVAARLSLCVAKEDVVARLGGDEFAIIHDGGGQDESEAVAARLIEVLGEPYDIEGRGVAVAASIGIAMAPRDGDDTESLLKYADLALYGAKADGGRAFKVFAPEMNERLQARRVLEQDLRDALGDNALALHYQPSIDLATGRVVGFEALLRWSHPKRGAVSPAEFVPIAENIGLIDKLGEWVLRRACADAAGWPADVRVFVNLSPLQFKSRKVLQSVLIALASSGLPARRLELEITESVLLQENETNLATLHELRALGARIALDDFGIGYSSLSYLRMFPFDKIKIDRSFVMALPDNLECVKIIRAMVELAKSLGMDTTAEGIETAEQLAQLEALGCAEGQGFLFSRARPASDIADMLAQGGSVERAA